jgi:hypothetical protein
MLHIEVAQIVLHKANRPDVIVHFFDSDRLAGGDLAEVDFLFAQPDAATPCEDNLVVQRVSPDPASRGRGAVKAGRSRPGHFMSKASCERWWLKTSMNLLKRAEAS